MLCGALNAGSGEACSAEHMTYLFSTALHTDADRATIAALRNTPTTSFASW